ncbi:hypothetical protein ACH35V_30640 [Actinomadura sp. 1N219]|uniref:hypothetical protein n=1 Tax=Actinomadura sp. 1N219 TaxID=3375152 RepID=UPI0037AAEF84
MNASPQENKIEAFEPLPAVGEAASGRWAAPYLAQQTSLWTVHVRRPLTHRQVDAGLADTVCASTLDALETAMTRQDEMARELSARPNSVPTWSREA